MTNEGRKPKAESQNSKQFAMTEFEMFKTGVGQVDFGNSDFEFVSDFGFPISDSSGHWCFVIRHRSSHSFSCISLATLFKPRTMRSASARVASGVKTRTPSG